ncbi:Fic family protein [Nocardia takedensis]|uniref:Fic family protein n=2 Tax=Nocardia takedensis TaxID=259390 RepID=UPI000A30F6BA|nr:Fic/DOC family N-terminal domain-containing protein [Nocardia takedensis]
MRSEMFVNSSTGALVPISGTDPRWGEWSHVAFVPDPLPQVTPELTVPTFNVVAKARAALAALDASARQLPNPALLRQPTLRQEAQSTSALEGTFAPLEDVLGLDTDEQPSDATMREVFNYVVAADRAFHWVGDGRPLTVGMLESLQGILVDGTPANTAQAGRIRTTQVVIGSHQGARVHDARFIPSPPGIDFEARVRDFVEWVMRPNDAIDPLVMAGMAHYQFETLHPFNDGNGRIGRLLIVLQLHRCGILSEPTLTVSPWFEARRAEYYDKLLAVSTTGNWDSWIRFFAEGVAVSADNTARQLTDLIRVQRELKAKVRAAGLRAENAMRLVDYALAQPIFTVRNVERHLGVTYTRANALVGQLIDAGALSRYGDSSYGRRFIAPDVLAIILR